VDVILRVVLRNPLPGVSFAVQLGRDKLLEPTSCKTSALTFDTSIKVVEGKSGTTLSGPAIQGRAGEKFVYVNSGKRAGQASSCWDRRAKVMLSDVDANVLKQLRDHGGTLVTEINGTGGDGGPSCARVPILGGGWRIT
jgi:hypothetical protein